MSVCPKNGSELKFAHVIRGFFNFQVFQLSPFPNRMPVLNSRDTESKGIVLPHGLMFRNPPLAMAARVRFPVLIAQYFEGKQLAEFIYAVYDWRSRFNKASIM